MSPVLELKSMQMTGLALRPGTLDLDAIQQELQARLAKAPDLLKGSPIVLDLALLGARAEEFDLAECRRMLQTMGLSFTGVRAAVAGEPGVGDGFSDKSGNAPTAPAPAPTPAQEEEKAPPLQVALPTLLVRQPVRAGQRIHTPGNLVVIVAVNAGAELLAGGDIHVYGPLRGRAHAGVTENGGARIFCHAMEAELVSIAGIYRNIDRESLPDGLFGAPAHVHLEGEQLRIEPLYGKS